jgi:hypothetical protein
VAGFGKPLQEGAGIETFKRLLPLDDIARLLLHYQRYHQQTEQHHRVDHQQRAFAEIHAGSPAPVMRLSIGMLLRVMDPYP